MPLASKGERCTSQPCKPRPPPRPDDPGADGAFRPSPSSLWRQGTPPKGRRRGRRRHERSLESEWWPENAAGDETGASFPSNKPKPTPLQAMRIPGHTTTHQTPHTITNPSGGTTAPHMTGKRWPSPTPWARSTVGHLRATKGRNLKTAVGNLTPHTPTWQLPRPALPLNPAPRAHTPTPTPRARVPTGSQPSLHPAAQGAPPHPTAQTRPGGN